MFGGPAVSSMDTEQSPLSLEDLQSLKDILVQKDQSLRIVQSEFEHVRRVMVERFAKLPKGPASGERNIESIREICQLLPEGYQLQFARMCVDHAVDGKELGYKHVFDAFVDITDVTIAFLDATASLLEETPIEQQQEKLLALKDIVSEKNKTICCMQIYSK